MFSSAKRRYQLFWPSETDFVPQPWLAGSWMPRMQDTTLLASHGSQTCRKRKPHFRTGMSMQGLTDLLKKLLKKLLLRRAAARFNAVIVPFGSIGSADNAPGHDTVRWVVMGSGFRNSGVISRADTIAQI